MSELGLSGYVILILTSTSISLLGEFIRLFIKLGKSKKRIETKLLSVVEKNSKFEILTDAESVIKYNEKIIDEANVIMALTGSRSRDKLYLKKIEHKLIQSPEVIHYRVLYGQPHNRVFKDHLIELMKIRNPQNRDYGQQTIFLGLFDDVFMEPEKFVCANEKEALIILPSIHGVSNYDTALLIKDAKLVSSMIHYVKELYSAGKTIETVTEIKKLKTIRTKAIDARGL